MAQLRNIYDKATLRKRLDSEPFERHTISFYRYVIIADPHAMRDELYSEWSKIGALGRIYIAREGINAQMSVPVPHFDEFIRLLYARKEFNSIPFKHAVDGDGKGFLKLTIKVRNKIVADGLNDDSFDVTNVGKHLNAREWNEAMQQPDIVIVDMRNQYESEVGHFEGALLPDADTFKEELPMVLDQLKGKEDKKVLLYCTGGVRCEKASAFLKHHGFQDVNQLHGGIIDYVRQIRTEQLPSRFIGKNFVFDERLGERITNDIIAKCHQCGSPCDDHTNCANDACHLLFIQCSECKAKFDGCCTPACRDILHLPENEQRRIRREIGKNDSLSVYKSRLRPNLSALIAEGKTSWKLHESKQ
ncbi:MAG TPA: hypothetical protein DEP18_03520 [Flavobacteriales bacterium]|nr:hypothetical protein [Flavobacteriales bacterium]HRE73762.1 rhodanese-related sulfurtransferase [Flavobacteriales bacterium]HRJ39696.1 rhodanese-related sulfurtransferase [Flavobacteriales bacterium]